jgi:Cu+-exporting ATPase
MSTRQISFAIQGMRGACAKCAVKIETVLAQLDGIIAAQVNYASERAAVVYDPARVHTAAMVDAVRSVGFDTALEHMTLDVRDLIYASGAHTIERILRRAEGVADVSVDLHTGRVTVTALPERASRDYFQVLLMWLGFRKVVSPESNAASGFVIRCLLLIGAAIMLIMAALNHLGIFAVATELPALFWLIALGTLGLLGAGYPFYRRAFAILTQGEFDASVLVALVASVTFFGGLVLALISRDRQTVWVWSAWAAFIFAPILTAGWFIARGLALWVLPRFRHTVLSNNLAAMTAPQSQLGVISDGTRR